MREKIQIWRDREIARDKEKDKTLRRGLERIIWSERKRDASLNRDKFKKTWF